MAVGIGDALVRRPDQGWLWANAGVAPRIVMVNSIAAERSLAIAFMKSCLR
jgi:hypothetical protein